MATLQLIVDHYGQRVDPDNPRDDRTVPIRRGDIFETKNQAEADRLVEIGAALDPKKAQEARADDLERQRAQLEAQQAAIDEQIAGLSAQADPADLKGKALDEALQAASLSTEGSADEKRARLAEYQQSQG